VPASHAVLLPYSLERSHQPVGQEFIGLVPVSAHGSASDLNWPCRNHRAKSDAKEYVLYQ
jgi:hypothetical protein